jgi:hypothetical protein
LEELFIHELAYEKALVELQKVKDHLRTIEELKMITSAKEEVLGRFHPIFTKEHLPVLTEEEFHDFLLFRNNHHWTGLQHNASANCADMDLLRGTLLRLIGTPSASSRTSRPLSL